MYYKASPTPHHGCESTGNKGKPPDPLGQRRLGICAVPPHKGRRPREPGARTEGLAVRWRGPSAPLHHLCRGGDLSPWQHGVCPVSSACLRQRARQPPGAVQSLVVLPSGQLQGLGVASPSSHILAMQRSRGLAALCKRLPSGCPWLGWLFRPGCLQEGPGLAQQQPGL